LCRYAGRIGDTNYEHISTELFGNIQTLRASVYLPMRIECVDNWASPSSGITRSSVAANHTLYPYWAISYLPSFHAETEHVLNGGHPSAEFDRVGVLKSRMSWSKHLKLCPLCAAEDAQIYGETYWHRQHQPSEIFYCTKHQIRLVNSSVLLKSATIGFYPASSIAIA
jgi:hypothetical protein